MITASGPAQAELFSGDAYTAPNACFSGTAFVGIKARIVARRFTLAGGDIRAVVDRDSWLLGMKAAAKQEFEDHP